MSETQYDSFAKFLEGYDIHCTLNDEQSQSYCKTYEGDPCCFFCRDKAKCWAACKNDPTVCKKAANFEKGSIIKK